SAVTTTRSGCSRSGMRAPRTTSGSSGSRRTCRSCSPGCSAVPRPEPRTASTADLFTSWHDGNVPSGLDRVSELELQRAAAFRSALRRFLARTEEVASAAGLTPQRYDLLLMIKSGAQETSTATELMERLSLRQTAVTELVKRAVEAGLV